MIALAHFDIANKNARLYKKLQTLHHCSWMNMKQHQGTDIAMLRQLQVCDLRTSRKSNEK